MADRLSGVVIVDEDLQREFEARLVESSTLAFRVAYGVLRHREDAEDVAQEAFVKAHRSFRQLRDRDRFRAWLVRMTWRLALDRQRNDRRRVARERSAFGHGVGRHVGHHFSGAEGAEPSVAAEDLLARERAEHLWRAIDALPEKLRVVVVLAGIQEHDLGEVARLLEIPPGTVKSRLFLARQHMKEYLQWLDINNTTR